MVKNRTPQRIHEQRRCLGCKKSSSKKDLVRFKCEAATGKLLRDVRGSIGGRGAYLHAHEPCVRNAMNRSMWEHALRLSSGSIEESSFQRALQELREEIIRSLSKEGGEGSSPTKDDGRAQTHVSRRSAKRMRL